ncbi:hypothetical protein [Azospirillum doebereinerae]
MTMHDDQEYEEDDQENVESDESEIDEVEEETDHLYAQVEAWNGEDVQDILEVVREIVRIKEDHGLFCYAAELRQGVDSEDYAEDIFVIDKMQRYIDYDFGCLRLGQFQDMTEARLARTSDAEVRAWMAEYYKIADQLMLNELAGLELDSSIEDVRAGIIKLIANYGGIIAMDWSDPNYY